MESNTVQRKLAAIFAADVVGYSRLMNSDEVGTLAALKAHRRVLVDPGHCQLSRPWYARCVGGAAARVGRSFARLLCCPALTERDRKKAPWVR
jgi:hypothetical protein